MRFFFDNMISPRFAQMLSALGEDVTHLRDHFAEDTKDVIFLPKLAEHGDVFITNDKSMQTRQAEARALIEAGVVSLFLGPFWGKKNFWDQAIWLVRRWPQLRVMAEGLDPPTCMDIQENGRGRAFRL